jgi:hypothetical protein
VAAAEGARGRVARWLRRPSTAVAFLGVAVVVGVVQGQPPPAVRDSGRSVPVREPGPTDGTAPAEPAAPTAVGTLLAVVDGGVVRFDTATGTATPVRLPRGFTALRAFDRAGSTVVLGRAGSPRTVAYVLRAGKARPLGPAEVAVPSADGTAVWVVSRRVARKVPLAGGPTRAVRLPPYSRLVGETPAGLIVSTGTVPDPKLPEDRGAPVTPSPTTSGPGPTGTVPATPGGTPTGSRSPSPAPVTTAPPYTTASPVPSAGPAGVPLTTLVVRLDGRTRYLAGMEALAATGDVVLLRDQVRRLAVGSPLPGAPEPRFLPKLQAVEAIGPGVLDATGATFAVLGRTNDYPWLMVGPTSARTNGEINVVALDGGAPVEGAAPPAFTASGQVLTVRPDGRVVYYRPGERDGFTIAAELPPATAVTPS